MIPNPLDLEVEVVIEVALAKDREVVVVMVGESRSGGEARVEKKEINTSAGKGSQEVEGVKVVQRVNPRGHEVDP